MGDCFDNGVSYSHTLRELEAYAPSVRPGGTIFCHDTRMSTDVLRHLDLPLKPRQPVAAALNTWCKETGHTWEEHPGYHGLGVVKV